MDVPEGLSDRVERWMARIPGIRTYKDREHRREVDKSLREHLASRLEEIRSFLQRLSLEWVQKGRLDPLGDLDRLSTHLQQLAHSIRHAAYGYSGIFDLQKIRTKDMDQIYHFDLSLLDGIEGIHGKVHAWILETSPESLKSKIQEAERLASELEDSFQRRKDFLGRPRGKGL